MFFLVRLFGNSIRGFLVQARMPGNTPSVGVNPMLLGSFQTVSGQQTLACDLAAAAANEVMLILKHYLHVSWSTSGFLFVTTLTSAVGTLILTGNSHPYKAYLLPHATRFGEANNQHRSHK